MSEVISNKYLDFGGLKKYDELLKVFIANGNKELADAIGALNDKIGSLEIEGSDDKTIAEAIADIYSSIEEIVVKQGALEDMDAELADKDAELLGKINGIIGELEEGANAMTLVEIANKFKAVEDDVKKNADDIAGVTSRVSTIEGTIEDLKNLGGENGLVAVVDKVNKNVEDIKTLQGDVETLQGDVETLNGEGEGSVKKTAQDAADAAEEAAKEYADSLVMDGENPRFDAAGAAAQALEDAQAYADEKAGAAQTAAEKTAKEYADSLVKDADGKSLFDAAGAAAQALADAKVYAEEYADSLATNYDAAGSAAAAQEAAEANAKAYAASLVENEDGSVKFDAAGAAEQALEDAQAYVDEKAGANAELIGGLADRIGGLENIAHAANVVYNSETKFINIVDAEGAVIGEGFDASPFIVDGMLDGVAFEEVEGVKTNNLVFTFNTAAGGKENIVVDFTKYVDIYQGDGSSIELNSETKTFSVKEVDASKTKLSTSIEVNGGPLADDASDNWPWTVDGKKVIPAGKTMEEILTSLFLKVTNGTVSKGSITWNPTLSAPSVSITQSGTVEVGTKLTATANTTNTVSGNSRSCTFTCRPGHFLSTGTDDEGKLVFGSYVSGNKTVTANAVDPATTGEPSIKTYWNGTEVTNVNGTTEYTVSVVGTNTFKVDQSGVKAYAGAFDDITVYGATNTKVPVESVKASIANDTAPAAKDLTSTNKAEVTGARAYWMGAMATPLAEFTSASIREAGEDAESGLVKSLGANPATTLAVPAGQYDVVIATQKEISVVTSAAQFGSAITGNFTANHIEVNIEGANGFTAIKYHVYHCNANWDEDTLTISYK